MTDLDKWIISTKAKIELMKYEDNISHIERMSDYQLLYNLILIKLEEEVAKSLKEQYERFKEE